MLQYQPPYTMMDCWLWAWYTMEASTSLCTEKCDQNYYANNVPCSDSVVLEQSCTPADSDERYWVLSSTQIWCVNVSAAMTNTCLNLHCDAQCICPHLGHGVCGCRACSCWMVCSWGVRYERVNDRWVNDESQWVTVVEVNVGIDERLLEGGMCDMPV